MPRSNPNSVTVGTEVVCDGIRGVVKAIDGSGDLAYITWEDGKLSTCCCSSVRKSGPAVIHGLATVRLAKLPNRLQEL